MAAKAEAVEPRTPSQMVQDAVDESPTTLDAARLLEQWARSNPDLREYLTEPWLHRACLFAAGKATRGNRKSVWTAPNYTAGGNGERVHAHGRTLLDFPLPGGIRLRDAKRSDLETAAHFYREQAEDMASKADWLEAIASKVGRKKVSSVFDEQALEALRA